MNIKSKAKAIAKGVHEFFSADSEKALKKQLTGAGLGSLLVTISNILLGMVLVIILARTLGPAQYGVYTYILTFVSILSIPAKLGLPNLIVRETSKSQVSADWGRMRGLWRWSNIVAALSSLFVVLICYSILCLFFGEQTVSGNIAWFWGLTLIPIMTFTSLRGAAMQGLRKITMGRAPDQILRPALLCLLLIITAQWGGHTNYNHLIALQLHLLAAATALVVGVYLLSLYRPSELRERPIPKYENGPWLKAIFPLALTGAMFQINRNADILMIGHLMSPIEVGVYRIAVQGALLTSFGLQVVGMFISPFFASLHEQQDLPRLQKLATVSARVALLFALPCFLVVLAWGSQLIEFIFGTEYKGAYIPLLILAGGQVVNSFFGYVGIILNMCGFQNNVARVLILTALLNLVCNAAMIPKYGITGAAAATSTTLIVFNVLLWWEALRCLSVNTAAIKIGLRAQDVK